MKYLVSDLSRVIVTGKAKNDEIYLSCRNVGTSDFLVESSIIC